MQPLRNATDSSNDWSEGLGEKVQKLVQELQEGLGSALRLSTAEGAIADGQPC